MDLKQLECFVQVAEIGSLSKAAVVLGIAQPALSRHVRCQEMALREYLVLRNGRGITLTEADKRLFDHSVGGFQRAVHHRPGVRRLRSRGAQRKRRGGLGACGETGRAPNRGPGAGDQRCAWPYLPTSGQHRSPNRRCAW
jgi:DNA-binding transcriptional LysR family regulator